MSEAHGSSEIDLISLMSPGNREKLVSMVTSDRDSLNMSALAVAVVSPSAERRKAIVGALQGSPAKVTRELTAYPGIDDLGELTEADHDVVVVDLDADPNPPSILLRASVTGIVPLR
jgi:hypothetical protein